MVDATIGKKQNITADINVNTTSGPQKVAVTLPASSGGASNSSMRLALLGDVDTSNLNDGAMLQYRASDAKFVARNEIITTTGTILFNCGSF